LGLGNYLFLGSDDAVASWFRFMIILANMQLYNLVRQQAHFTHVLNTVPRDDSDKLIDLNQPQFGEVHLYHIPDS
jgi:hypothetical protein